jgi:TonB-linked SusC/RagA family outer membrane protein
VASVFVLMMLVFSAGSVAAQTGVVKGFIVDPDGKPLVGATIVVEGTNRGITSDANGRFTIRATSNETLSFSYLGYTSQKHKVGNRTMFNIELQPDESTKMDEVVVIGYGSVKKSDMTGSVANVKMSDIKDAPVLSVDQALQGRIAGADIMSTTGEPGATTTIRIRGTRSISASNEPLIVVDGVIDAIHDLNDINSTDIASISVLKDASSTAIYGSRGSNGVIIITTKQGAGSLDRPNITFKADMGFSQLPRMLDIMNASEFAQYRNDYAYFGGDANNPDVNSNSPLSSAPYSDPLSKGKGTNWIKEITRTAIYQNYAIAMSGRTNKSASYYTSFSYNETEGIIDGSGLQRITGRVNLDRQLFKWLKVGYKGSYTWRHNDENKASIGGTTWYDAAQYLNPMLTVQDDYNPLYYSGQKINNPRAKIDLITYYTERHSSNHTGYMEIVPVKNLKFRSQLSYYLYQRHTYRYYPSTLPKKNEGEGGEAYRAEYDEYSLSSENTLTYARRTKSGHSVNAMLGFSGQVLQTHNFTLSGSGYMDDAVKWNNMNAVLDKQTYSASTSYTKKTRMSTFARLNYSYKSRYFLTVTGRFDGASNFAKNNKWAFFPSAAFKWNIAKEKFMKKVSWVDELALRLSAGRTGNDAISAYRSLAALSSTTSGYLFDGSQPVAFYRSRLDIPDLRWEKTDTYNAALDVSLFKNRLNVTAEWYISKTNDLLLTVQVPTQTGYSSRYGNVGATTNKGWEFTIESRNIVHPKFQWTTTLTLSHNEQMVDDIGSESFVKALSAPSNNNYMMYGYMKGYPLNALWGFKYGGVWHNQDEVERNEVTKTYASATSSKANGYPRYYDINHDGALNQDDLVYLGNADPYLYGGLQNTFHIGNLSLGIYWAYSLGGKIYNYSELYMSGSTFTNQYRYMLDSWHPVRNPNSDIPRAGSIDAHVPSDFEVHDASYLRLKNINIGYTFDFSKRCKWMKNMTVSVSGENLWLWKKYNGFDPDVSSEGTSSTLRRVDLGAYPKPRTIIFSLQFRY